MDPDNPHRDYQTPEAIGHQTCRSLLALTMKLGNSCSNPTSSLIEEVSLISYARTRGVVRIS